MTTDEEMQKISEEIFLQMLSSLLSISKINDLLDNEKCIIAHTVLANLIGGYFSGIGSLNGISNELLEEPMKELFDHAKQSLTFWRKRCNSGLM